jgi:sucrose phosphorylase
MHDVLKELCSSAIVITETNVPHTENITYFGDGNNESQIIYNFSLPSLTLNAFYSGKAEHLTEWAKILVPPGNECTYFNFLDTHDGIGILGAKGILSQEEIDQIFSKIKEHKGELAYRVLPDGSNTVYEMNSTWWSALNNENEEAFDLQLQKFVCSRAIAFSLKGVPAIYYLSFFGQANDLELFARTSIKRDINRTNLDLSRLEKKLAKSDSKEGKVFARMAELMNRRKSFRAFHPNSPQEILNLDPRIFALVRGEDGQRVLALHNIAKDKVTVAYQNKEYELEPYGFLWEKI